jgi:hypothetical protein
MDDFFSLLPQNIRNRFSYIGQLIRLSSEVNKGFLSQLQEVFYQTLIGLFPYCPLNLESKFLESLQYLIYYLRITSGIDIFIIKYNNLFLFVNFDNIISKFSDKITYSQKNNIILSLLKNLPFELSNAPNSGFIYLPDLKNKFLQNLEEQSNLDIKSNIKSLVILTHNRPNVLENTLNEYIANLKKFGHKDIRIIISDDSDKNYSIENFNIVEVFRKKFNYIFYLNNSDKENILNFFIKEAENLFPDINRSKLEKYLFYTFGGIGDASHGRNRNFVFLLLNKEDFLMVDDDCSPNVLTINQKVVQTAIKRLSEQGFTDLNLLENFILPKEKNDLELLPVDFISYFSNSNRQIPQYVKYSGQKDIKSIYILLSQLGFTPQNFGVYQLLSKRISEKELDVLKKSLETKYFIYGEKENHKIMLKGLCCYFPLGAFQTKLTIAENFRVEDLIIGANYKFLNNIIPVEANIAMYHQSDIDRSKTLKPEYIYSELFCLLIYYTYFTLLKDLTGNVSEKVLTLNRILESSEMVKVPEAAFKKFYEYRDEFISILNNCIEISKDQADTYEILIYIRNNLKKLFFSVSQEEFEKEVKYLVRNILKDYSNSLILSGFLEKTNFDFIK